MSGRGWLSHSVAALASSVPAQEALLRDLAARRPAATFFDRFSSVNGDVPVRVAGGRVERETRGWTAPPDLGAVIVEPSRDAMDFLVDRGDIILPGWGAFADDSWIVIEGIERLICDLEEFAPIVQHVCDSTDPAARELAPQLRVALERARRDALPIAAYW